MRYISIQQLIGCRIKTVLHVNLKKIDDFQERIILIDLVPYGLIDLDYQSQNVKLENGTLIASGFAPPANTIPEFTQATHPELNSPISGVFIPFGWETQMGISLENGFVLHNGFSMNDNGAMLYNATTTTRDEFVFIAGSK